VAGQPGATYRGHVHIGRAERPQVHLITGAPKGITDDQAYRVRGYVISMSARIVLFITAVVVSNIWLRVILLLTAAFLPYFAVIFANSGREPVRDEPEYFAGDAPRQLPAGPPSTS
jgi:hypothetical protein